MIIVAQLDVVRFDEIQKASDVLPVHKQQIEWYEHMIKPTLSREDPPLFFTRRVNDYHDALLKFNIRASPLQISELFVYDFALRAKFYKFLDVDKLYKLYRVVT